MKSFGLLGWISWRWRLVPDSTGRNALNRIPGPTAGLSASRAPIESEILAQYEAEVLAQYRMSFRCRLTFAALGVAFVVLAALMHSPADGWATVGRLAVGMVMNLAALFSAPSKQAQESMHRVLDQLREDRDRAEARKLAESLPPGKVRDALIADLARHLTGMNKKPNDPAQS